ncbi:hypothetical protein GE061_017795 [Apolygus lucorum]|uniref:C2H2-type domain-containing protein n=1 Tax=Apolygus lucorum TaxID=248454 RepID=A0A8S9XE34_APOLU|nr:hypothetical protein GE061_017795 [Apolygus lucorum]
MKSTWYQLLLILVFSCRDGGAHNDQVITKNRDELNIHYQRKGSAASSDTRTLQQFEESIPQFPDLRRPNGINHLGEPRLKSKRGITPSYSISSDKYHVNISCRVFFKRSCALPDAAFIFKQLSFNEEEETTANWAGTEDIMELLTFQESEIQNGITDKTVHKTQRDRHRVINVDDDESKCVVKDAIAFESSRIGECTPFPHKGHCCHYHYKNHRDRKIHYFRHNKTARPTKAPHCTTSSTGTGKSVAVTTTTEDDLLKATPKDAATAKTSDATIVEDIEGLPRKTSNQSRIDLQEKINSSSSVRASE